METEGQPASAPSALTMSEGQERIEALLNDDGAFIEDAPITEESEPDDTPETESEGEDITDEGEPESNDEQAEEEQTVAVESLQDIAKALDVDYNEFLANLKIPVKVQGEEKLVSLTEAQKGYQLEQVVHKKTAELAEHRRTIDAERAQYQQAALKQHQDLGQLFAAAEQILLQDFNSPAMQELRTTNPAEWVARQTEQQQKLGRVQQLRQSAAQQFAAQQEQQSRDFQGYVEDQRQKFQSELEARGLPSDMAPVHTYLRGFGFNDQELGSVYDHRIALVLAEAHANSQKVAQLTKELESYKAKSDLAKKKVVAAPKLQKPGSSSKPMPLKTQNLLNLRKKLKASGKPRDADRLIEAMI